MIIDPEYLVPQIAIRRHPHLALEPPLRLHLNAELSFPEDRP